MAGERTRDTRQWTVWLSAALGRPVAVGDRPAGRFVRGVDVVPASRLAEVERERDVVCGQLSDAAFDAGMELEGVRADLARAREALEQAHRRLAQCERDRTERDKVLAQARTGMAEIDAALAEITSGEADRARG